MPAQAGIQAFFLALTAFFLDSRFRGNDVSSFLSTKNLPLKGDEEWAFVDQGDTREQPRQEAAASGIKLEVVTLPKAKPGFVLLLRRWVMARSSEGVARFRRLALDSERLPDTLAGLHFLAFAMRRQRFGTLLL